MEDLADKDEVRFRRQHRFLIMHRPAGAQRIVVQDRLQRQPARVGPANRKTDTGRHIPNTSQLARPNTSLGHDGGPGCTGLPRQRAHQPVSDSVHAIRVQSCIEPSMEEN